MLHVNSSNTHTSHHPLSLRVDYREGNLRRLGKAERLSSGALRLRANMTRTGVLEYATGNEYRPPEEVFDAESLASLQSAPVVIGHPPSGEVTLDTWSEAVGHVESVERNGSFVSGTLIIRDPRTIEMLEGGHLVELSPGYTARVERQDGKGPDGKPFAGVQKFIRYNHLALLPEGMGRSGSEVRVRTDSRLSARAIAAGWTDADLAVLENVSRLAVKAGWGNAPRTDARGHVPFEPEEVQALLTLARLPAVEAMVMDFANENYLPPDELKERLNNANEGDDIEALKDNNSWLHEMIARW